MALKIVSSAFGDHQPIPRHYTGDGKDESPAVNWSGIPSGTKELALIMDDPDAPTTEPWVHWVLYKIPPETTGLPQGVAVSGALSAPAGSMQGRNSWNKTGYGGPAPPRGHGVHHYYFKLYALDTALDAAPGLSKDELLERIEGHVLEEAELVGTYQR